MTVVVGTAGHIDHGKTTLLRALTGIDADRLPEEQRRGLTIDVGYAHGSPDDGDELDFVDVPGHDRLVGNMLVGVGEIDAVLIVVAADDGPQAQTWEHLGLLDAIGVRDAVVAITKVEMVTPDRVAFVGVELVRALDATALASPPVVGVSAIEGTGMRRLRAELAQLRDRVTPKRHTGAWLHVDRAFGVRGHGVVVTGSSRGSAIATGDTLRLRPGDRAVRVRGVHVHDQPTEASPEGGRVALNIVGVDLAEVHRGGLLTAPSEPEAGEPPTAAPQDTDRLLVLLRCPAAMPGRLARDPWPPHDGVVSRLHLGTDSVEAVVGRSGRDDLSLQDGRSVAMVRTERSVATAIGEQFLLRRPPPAGLLAGGVVLDPAPPRGRARRRQTADRIRVLVDAVESRDAEWIGTARLDLHGILGSDLAPDLYDTGAAAAHAAVASHHAVDAESPGIALSTVRAAIITAIRPHLTAHVEVDRAVERLIDTMVEEGSLVPVGERIRLPGHSPVAPDPAVAEAQARLMIALDGASPPSLSAAATQAGCDAGAVRELERDGRIIVVDDDLAWTASAFDRLRAQAVALAVREPLTPAALRDASGTSRKYVMALLGDLDRRSILRRTPAGHVPGPRAQEQR